MEFDGHFQRALAIIATTRKELEQRGEVERLEQMKRQLDIVGYTVDVSIIRARRVQPALPEAS